MSLKKPNDLEEGMVLAADVFNLDGQILFTKGVELTARQIDILQSWGIQNVEIEGGDDAIIEDDLDNFPPAIIAKAERLVSDRFKLAKSPHPAVEIIHKMCVTQKAKEIAKLERAK
ncbi:MAG: hypothetical protein AAGB46_13570 [Verrucomicrobiota bacterium]